MPFLRSCTVAASAMLCATLSLTSLNAETLRMVIQSHADMGAKCVDVPNQQFVPGTAIRMWDCNSTIAQIFSYDDTAKQLTIGSLCVESRGQGNPQGTVGLGSCNGGANQHWQMLASGDYYRIVGTRDLCVAIKDADKTSGASLNIDNCQDRANQLWALVEAPAVVAEAPAVSTVRAAVNWGNGKIFMFQGGNYLRFDLQSDRLDDGYPKPIAGNWAGLPATWSAGVDTALNLGNGKVYLFKGPEYVRYDIFHDRADGGYPQPIAKGWHGLPEAWSSGIDAALTWGNGKIYFFKGPDYIRYDLPADKVDGGYPQPIAKGWHGLPEAWSSGIDAALSYGSGKIYFFKGQDYVRYDISNDKVDGDYPRPIAKNWRGLQ